MSKHYQVTQRLIGIIIVLKLKVLNDTLKVTSLDS